MWRWVNLFGTSMAAYLDEHNMPGRCIEDASMIGIRALSIT